MKLRTKERFINADEFRDDWRATKLFLGETAYIDMGSITDAERSGSSS